MTDVPRRTLWGGAPDGASLVMELRRVPEAERSVDSGGPQLVPASKARPSFLRRHSRDSQVELDLTLTRALTAASGCSNPVSPPDQTLSGYTVDGCSQIFPIDPTGTFNG